MSELGGLDILVNNAAHQSSFKSIDDISDEEWELTFRVNIHAMFYLCKAAVRHMRPGSVIINTTSINADQAMEPHAWARRDWRSRRCGGGENARPAVFEIPAAFDQAGLLHDQPLIGFARANDMTPRRSRWPGSSLMMT